MTQTDSEAVELPHQRLRQIPTRNSEILTNEDCTAKQKAVPLQRFSNQPTRWALVHTLTININNNENNETFSTDAGGTDGLDSMQQR